MTFTDAYQPEASLSPVQREAINAHLDEVIDTETGSGLRITVLEDVIAGQCEEGDPAAMAFRRACLRAGYGSRLRARVKWRNLLTASLGGEVKTKPGTAGVQRTDEDGVTRWEQPSLWEMTFVELRQSYRDDLTRSRTFDESAELKARLLALAELAPGCVSPAAVVTLLGLSREGWLMGEEAA